MHARTRARTLAHAHAHAAARTRARRRRRRRSRKRRGHARVGQVARGKGTDAGRAGQAESESSRAGPDPSGFEPGPPPARQPMGRGQMRQPGLACSGAPPSCPPAPLGPSDDPDPDPSYPPEMGSAAPAVGYPGFARRPARPLFSSPYRVPCTSRSGPDLAGSLEVHSTGILVGRARSREDDNIEICEVHRKGIRRGRQTRPGPASAGARATAPSLAQSMRRA